jgi:EF-hand domain
MNSCGQQVDLVVRPTGKSLSEATRYYEIQSSQKHKIPSEGSVLASITKIEAMAAPIKMDELLVSWLGSDEVFENVLKLIEKYRVQRKQKQHQPDSLTPPGSPNPGEEKEGTESVPSSPRGVAAIPPFYPLKTSTGATIPRRRKLPRQSETWDPMPLDPDGPPPPSNNAPEDSPESTTRMEDGSEFDVAAAAHNMCVRDQTSKLLQELQIGPMATVNAPNSTLPLEAFVRITKEICHFPSFFNGPLYQRILDLWNIEYPLQTIGAVTLSSLEWYWKKEMEPFDPPERFFRLVKQPDQDCILRDDFLPYIKALLNDHPVGEWTEKSKEVPSVA